ncbi:hypothetical protein BJV77DRAFT_1000153 [Russula vinacea]|jgi:hypothetical protein|nr:hypothetical protein BJV77DRAFT_1000153 [Russula vinacea]
MGGNTQCLAIEDEGSASEASSRRMAGPSRSGLVIAWSTRVIIDPRISCVWMVGDLKDGGGFFQGPEGWGGWDG